MTWSDVVDTMLAELRGGSPRAEAYWAQQLAFGPVLVHALALWLRGADPSLADRQALAAAVSLALGGFGPLPEELGLDPGLLAALARRQARAVAWGRPRTLRRLLARLGAGPAASPAAAAAAGRLVRPYPLLGWEPDQQLAV